MSFSDPIADLITRIRNGHMARKRVVKTPLSKLRRAVLEALLREGYIGGFKVSESSPGMIQAEIELKYVDGAPAISEISRVSVPGCRVYQKINRLGKFYNGLGSFILSTPCGVLLDYEARQQNVGGEVLIKVF